MTSELPGEVVQPETAEYEEKASLPYIFRKARLLIEEHGWVQGMYGTLDTGFCAIGAIMAATPDGNSCWDARALLNQIVFSMTGGRTGVASWNDAIGRQKGEVIELLKNAEYLSASETLGTLGL